MLDITPEEFTATVAAAGFEVEEDSVIDESFYLLVRHPEHEGTELAVLICEDEVVEVERNVIGGEEGALSANLGQDEFDNLNASQKNHLYNIDFGEPIDAVENITTIEELLAIFNEQIKVRPTL